MAVGSDSNGNSIRITQREVYDEVLKLKAMTQEMQQSLKGALTEHEEYEKRIRGLELKFYGVLAGMFGGAFVILRMGQVI